MTYYLARTDRNGVLLVEPYAADRLESKIPEAEVVEVAEWYADTIYFEFPETPEPEVDTPDTVEGRLRADLEDLRREVLDKLDDLRRDLDEVIDVLRNGDV